MRLTITDQLVARTANDGQAVPFAVKVYDDSTEPWVLSVPTTLQYRIDNPDTGYQVSGWTTVTPASSATITVTGALGTLDGGDGVGRYCTGPRVKRQITVRANAGLSTVAVMTREFWIRNISGLTS